MNDPVIENQQYTRTLIRWVRLAAWPTAIGLMLWSTGKIGVIESHRFPWLVWLTFAYTLIHAIWMLIPWNKAESEKLWKTGIIGYLGLSFFLVFLLIANIMVDASAAGAAGEKLGVPGLEGTLLFLALAQLPGLWFARYPEKMS